MTLPPFLRPLRFSLGIPLGLTTLLALLMQPGVAAMLAWPFGPWAGLLFGHSDCTLGNQAPAPYAVLALVGAVALAGPMLARDQPWRGLTHALVSVWAVAWGGAALLSVANTLI